MLRISSVHITWLNSYLRNILPFFFSTLPRCGSLIQVLVSTTFRGRNVSQLGLQQTSTLKHISTIHAKPFTPAWKDHLITNLIVTWKQPDANAGATQITLSNYTRKQPHPQNPKSCELCKHGVDIHRKLAPAFVREACF